MDTSLAEEYFMVSILALNVIIHWNIMIVNDEWEAAIRFSVPLILAAWAETSIEAKRERVKEHLEYAEQEGVLHDVESFLKNLTEDQWYLGT